MSTIISLDTLYTETAKLSDLESYVAKAQALAGSGTEVTLTGQAPVWLYLKIAHALPSTARPRSSSTVRRSRAT